MSCGVALVRVNDGHCQKLAHRLRSVHVLPDPYLKRPANSREQHQEANYWLYVTAICQSTRTFEGTIEGRWLRGWDYLVVATRRCIEQFTASRMLDYAADELKALLSDDFNPASSRIDRVAERLGQLHDCARLLLRKYGGEAMGVYQASGGFLNGEYGLLALLSEFDAFCDPLRKKSVLLAGMLQEAGIWPLKDPEHLKVAMDYHAMRVALRSGMIEVTDPGLQSDLREHKPVTDGVNQTVRGAVSAACDIMVAESGASVFAFDKLIWHLGRSCCFYEHEPICGPGRASERCFKRDRCSFLRATTYECPDHCVLDGVCKGSRDAAYRSYGETNVYTPHY